MANASEITVRAAQASDAPQLRDIFPTSGLPPKLEQGASGRFVTLMAVVGAGAPGPGVAGVLGVDLEGRPATPEAPGESAPRTPPEIFGVEMVAGIDPDLEFRVWSALHDEAERLAQERGAGMIGVALGVVDAALIKRYEQRGYEHVGPGPYRDMGGGHREYLQGYTDPVGFQLDYGKRLG